MTQQANQGGPEILTNPTQTTPKDVSQPNGKPVTPAVADDKVKAFIDQTAKKPTAQPIVELAPEEEAPVEKAKDDRAPTPAERIALRKERQRNQRILDAANAKEAEARRVSADAARMREEAEAKSRFAQELDGDLPSALKAYAEKRGLSFDEVYKRLTAHVIDGKKAKTDEDLGSVKRELDQIKKQFEQTQLEKQAIETYQAIERGKQSFVAQIRQNEDEFPHLYGYTDKELGTEAYSLATEYYKATGEHATWDMIAEHLEKTEARRVSKANEKLAKRQQIAPPPKPKQAPSAPKTLTTAMNGEGASGRNLTDKEEMMEVANKFKIWKDK